MSITGHRSKDGVHCYKEISSNQQEKLSEMIQHSKKLQMEDTQDVPRKATTQTFNFSNCSVTLHNH